MSSMTESSKSGVTSIMNYLGETSDRPAYYLYQPEPGYTPPPPPAVKHPTRFIDARETISSFSLDVNGFEFIRSPRPTLDYLCADTVSTSYYDYCAKLVTNLTGAAKVICFDYNVRDKSLAAEHAEVREPVRFAHNDYTELSAPERVRDLLADQADDALTRRYMFINVWRPLRGPVTDVPLAICDAASLSHDDFVATDLKYADRTGEIYSLKYREGQRWYFLNQMQDDEVVLLKCFDSATDGRARFTAHGAFRTPDVPETSLPRRSIEVRTIALFGQ